MSKHTSRITGDAALKRKAGHQLYEQAKAIAMIKFKVRPSWYDIMTENEPPAGTFLIKTQYGEAFLHGDRIRCHVSSQWLEDQAELKAGQVGANGAKYVKR